MIKKVICVDNNTIDGDALTYGKEYIVYHILKDSNNIMNGYYINNDYGVICAYFKYRFLDLKEYRKMKLLKLNNL